MHLGIIDIGSNSVRLVIAEIQQNGGYKIINDMKKSLRLGQDVELYGFISEEKIKGTIEALKSFKELCDYMKVEDIITVATEAIRKASNKDVILDRISKEIKISIKVLKGEEEAYLDGKAVLSSFYVRKSLVIDIGGASTELTLLEDNKISEFTCVPFGSINLTHRYGLEDIIVPNKEIELSHFLCEEFSKIPWLQNTAIENIIAIGGSARNLGRIDRKKMRYPLDISSGYTFSNIDLTQMYNMLKSKNLKQRHKVDGISHDRADIIVASTAILKTLTEISGVKNITVSGKGLREGILCEYIEANICPIGDILNFSLNSILDDHNMDKNHAYNVYGLTKVLFEALKPLHGLNDDFNRVLKTASILHDAGISIRYYDHHKHSFYIILNSPINGLSHKELIMSAYIAAYHRNNSFEINILPFTGIINRMDLENIEKLSILLRISESLDKNMMGAIKIHQCIVTDSSVTIILDTTKDVYLEIESALKCKERFYEIFKRDLIIKKL